MLVMSIANRSRGIRGVLAALQSGPAFLTGTGIVADELPTYTFWNELDMSASISLSDNALRATSLSEDLGCVRALDGKSAGKWYFEVFAQDMASSGSGLGLAQGSIPIDTIISDTMGAVVMLGNGGVFFDGNFLFSLGTLTGNVIPVAYDADAHLVWFQNGGDWNDDPLANPSTGVGGIDVSSIDGAGLFPVIGFQLIDQTGVGNFGAGGFFYPKPSGFNSWTTEAVS